MRDYSKPLNLEIVSVKPLTTKVKEPVPHAEGADNNEVVLQHLKVHGHISMPEGEDLYNVHRLASVINRLKKQGHGIENIQKLLGVNYGVYELKFLNSSKTA